ncbi:MAG TPA: serpin family protein [Chloroflexi bacterium]|jgi:serpin B|nr:serpin family protein [Chloroflexota bacterium]
MRKIIIVFLSGLMLLSACVPAAPVEEVNVEMQTGKANYDTDPQYTPEEALELALAMNKFAFDLYNEIGNEQENKLFSPFSLYQALMMLYAGAREQTAEQFESVMHLPWTDESLHRVSNALNIALSSKDSSQEDEQAFILQIANAIWGQQGAHIEQAYLDLLSANYAAGLRSVDFSQSQQAADLINQWAEEQTLGKIKDIAKPAMFNSNTRLALTNAVYFKGAWLYPFQEAATYAEDFTNLNGDVSQVDMMHSTESFWALKNEEVQIVELPYYQSSIVMDLIAPSDGDWQTFLQNLTLDKLNENFDDLSEARVELSLPKFKIETPEMELINPMKELGLVDVFGMEADLSGMSGDKSLYVSTLVQKAFIDVNEAGTEAAAVTLAVVQVKGMLSPETLKISFDKPFMFLLRDTSTSTILFAGQVVQP